MYNIKEAAARTGVSVPVLRAWERRYGIVEPARTPGGYRLYDDEALRRVRTMRRLVDDGWSPSTAAAALLSGEVAPDAVEPMTRSEPRARVASGDDRALGDRFVAAAAALDGRSVEEVLDEMFATGTFERVAEDHLVPALRALGDAWGEGRVAVAGEHLASNAVHRRLAAAFQAAGRLAASEQPILIGMPPGARHELGAMMFAVAARRAGLPVLYLGADLPRDDWLTAAEATHARAAVVGAPTAGDAAAAVAVADALRRVRPGIVVALGGAGIGGEMDIADGTVRLSEDYDAAIDALTAALETRRDRRNT
jgi:DNA-binding transcriptional MerR regulator/methylmalonyl-CoA mutase cobalamin-binding subunit